MSVRYTALNSSADRDLQRDDLEAAFDYSEDEDDDHNNPSESQPLNPDPTSPSHIQAPPVNPHPHIPGTYDFENVDYDYPPPGSPPRPSAIALPNNHGNSNGLIPSIEPDSVPGPRQNWFKRSAAAFLPTDVAQRLGLAHQRPAGAIGGGTNNDGVFANVTAKPTPPVTIQDGDETYIVPEESRADAPPSYASAQADAVPPYWETTVHAPFSPGSAGEIIVDNLPSGSLFSFLWNMLVSISFQFVGFLLTYLLHTTHAARLGSRAGLGVTLIQYGFALRGKLDSANGTENGWAGWGEVQRPTTTEGTPSYYDHHHGTMSNSTTLYPPTSVTEDQANSMMADATTEWLSFFLMTVGWFVLLTSLLGYWRVKRWERGILASQRNASTQPTATPSSLLSRMEQNFSLRGTSRIDLLRQGFGLGRNRRSEEDEVASAAVRAEEGNAQPRQDDEHALETDYMIPIDPSDPNRSRLIAQAVEHDLRLQRDLRNAGLL
ncbi:hypothetical protein D9615_000527 [Tricholomella constricta]|uniref:Metal homeostatis protein bsd2 n=1 Tax=Tricholomella constricta TaxID=117010 RepID=A0A8H5HR64_9AGAR|nr:hypothetical protein D9615_000527 [Tricholomella constricta]